MEGNASVEKSDLNSKHMNSSAFYECASKDDYFPVVSSACALSTNTQSYIEGLTQVTINSYGANSRCESEQILHENLTNFCENAPVCSVQSTHCKSENELSLSGYAGDCSGFSEHTDNSDTINCSSCQISNSTIATVTNISVSEEVKPHSSINLDNNDQSVTANNEGSSRTSISTIAQPSPQSNLQNIRTSFPRLNDLTLNIPQTSSVPQPSVSSPYDIPSAGYQGRQIEPVQVIITPRQAQVIRTYSTSALALSDYRPTLTSSIFSFMMTLVFVLVLWLVVYMVFGSRGHAIAGVFVGLFFIGILLNTCFLKFYIRLRLFLGMSSTLVTAEQDSQRNLQNEEGELRVKAAEEPPSYAVVDESPPPYDSLQYCAENQCHTKEPTDVVNISSSPLSSSCEKERYYICPYCENEGIHFGLCENCQKKLSQ